MSAIDNLNTKPIKEILTDVRSRFSNRANWQTNALSSPKGCMSVAEGIVTDDDYLKHYQEMDNLTVGEFSDQAAIYRAMAESRALQFLINDIATDNEVIAKALAKGDDGDDDEDEPAGIHYVDAAWTFNDGHDNKGLERNKEASYQRLLNSLDRAIERA